MKIPIFELKLNDQYDSITYVSLVDMPAIERSFQAFSKESQIQTFATEDEEQRIISGALMLANQPIFRKAANDMPDHYVVFRPETIKQFILKFFKQGNTDKVNMMHNVPIEDVFMFESWIVDRDNGKAPPEGFEGISDGSWFGSFKVDNKDIWENYIKTGIFTGFSVEGFFSYSEESADVDEEKLIAIKKIISEIDI
jgi:hypothetical protein